MQGQESISVKGLRMDIESKAWTAPKLWLHPKYGIGEMVDAINTDNEIWVIVLDFGGEIRKIRQDKLSVYGGVKVFDRLGKTLHPRKTEDEGEEETPILPEIRKGKLPPLRKMSTLEMVQRLREG